MLWVAFTAYFIPGTARRDLFITKAQVFSRKVARIKISKNP